MTDPCTSYRKLRPFQGCKLSFIQRAWPSWCPGHPQVHFTPPCPSGIVSHTNTSVSCTCCSQHLVHIAACPAEWGKLRFEGGNQLAQGRRADKCQDVGLTPERMLFPFCLLCLSLSHKCLCELWVLISWQLELRSQGISGTGHCCFLTAVMFQSLLSLGRKAHTWGWQKQSQISFPLVFAHREYVYCSCHIVSWSAGALMLNIIFIKVTREKGRGVAQFCCFKE